MENFAFELELPNRSEYQFYPVVHVSRLKKVRDYGKRPFKRLITGLTEADRFDFDVELLPEDSWEPGEASGRYEVEAIMDDDLPLSTRIGRTKRRFLVKWKGYDILTWEPLSNL